MIARLKRIGYKKTWTCPGNEKEDILIYDEATKNIKVKSTRDNQKAIQSFADSVDYNRIITASNGDISQVIREVSATNLEDVSNIQQYVDNPSKLKSYLTALEEQVTQFKKAQEALKAQENEKKEEVAKNE